MPVGDAQSYFAILYTRSPAEFLADSILTSPFLPRMLTKPRTVCFCQPVVAMISVSVAPLGRRMRAMTSDFLLVRATAASSAAFLAAFATCLPFFGLFVVLPGWAAFVLFFVLLSR